MKTATELQFKNGGKIKFGKVSKKNKLRGIKWNPNAKWINPKTMVKIQDLDCFYNDSLQSEMNKMNEAMNYMMNKQLFGKRRRYKDKRTWIKKLLDKTTSKISDFRVRVAEIIGGDDLHNDCDY